jgi:hypothetical protein
VQEILVTNLGGNDHLVDPYVNGSKIFQWTIRNENSSAGSGEGPVLGSCEHGNESLLLHRACCYIYFIQNQLMHFL